MTTIERPDPALLGRGADRTAAEITRQPSVWRGVPDRVPARLVDELRSVTARPDVRIVLTGAGTSAYAGQVAAPRLRQLLGRRVDAVATTDIVSAPRDVLDDVPTLLVSFARSGDSPESLAATRLADQLLEDVHHLVITTNADGRLAQEFATRRDAHVVLLPDADDAGFAMTSSFTSMIIATLLALGDEFDVAAVADTVEQALPRLTEAAGPLAGHSRVVYLGSGTLTGLAHEAALKLLELTAGRMPSLAESSLGFRHGPKAFLDEDTLVVVFVSSDEYTRRYDLDIVHELRRTLRGEQVLAISASNVDLPDDGPSWVLDGLPAHDIALAIGAAVAAQLIALRSALHLGIPADNPFPSGQLNRVVQGVTIHPLGADR